MKTVRVIANREGRISNRFNACVRVHFDLVETRDFVDGVPDLEFSFGNLRFAAEADSQIASLVQFRAPLVLSGAGIETTIRLNGPHAFTVMSVIQEIERHDTRAAA